MASNYFNEHLSVYSGHSMAANRNRSIIVLFTILMILLYTTIYSEGIITLLLLFFTQNSLGFDCN